MDDLDIPTPLARVLQRSGVQTIAQLESLADETLQSVPFLDPADIPVLRAAALAYWQRIQSYADSAPTPTDRRAVDIWRQRQQGASVNQVAAEEGVTGSYIRQMTQRGALCELAEDTGVMMCRSDEPLIRHRRRYVRDDRTSHRHERDAVIQNVPPVVGAALRRMPAPGHYVFLAQTE